MDDDDDDSKLWNSKKVIGVNDAKLHPIDRSRILLSIDYLFRYSYIDRTRISL